MATVALWIIQLVYISVVFYHTTIGREPTDDYKLELQPFKTIIGLLNFDYIVTDSISSARFFRILAC